MLTLNLDKLKTSTCVQMAWYQVLFLLSQHLNQCITRLQYLRSERKRGRVNDSMGYANKRCINTVQQCASELRCLLLIWVQCVWLRFTEF